MGSLVRPVAGRAMHMYISPRPSNLGESREIMRLLSQFGEIEYYKNLKYEALSQPRSATVIYKDEKAAEECLRRSPIRFRMGKVSNNARQEEQNPDTEAATSVPSSATDNDAFLQRGPLGTPFGLSPQTQTRSMSTSQSQVPRPPRVNRNSHMPFSSPQEPAPDSRIFEIVVNRSSRNYRERINNGHYHGPFVLDTKNVGQGDLARKVPTPGLSDVDWKHEEKPWHVTRTAKEQEYSGVKARVRLGVLWESAGHKEKWEEKMKEGEGEDEMVGVGVEQGMEEIRDGFAARVQSVLDEVVPVKPLDQVEADEVEDDRLKTW